MGASPWAVRVVYLMSDSPRARSPPRGAPRSCRSAPRHTLAVYRHFNTEKVYLVNISYYNLTRPPAQERKRAAEEAHAKIRIKVWALFSS